jgi:hypothetical protein
MSDGVEATGSRENQGVTIPTLEKMTHFFQSAGYKLPGFRTPGLSLSYTFHKRLVFLIKQIDVETFYRLIFR